MHQIFLFNLNRLILEGNIVESGERKGEREMFHPYHLIPDKAGHAILHEIRCD